MSAFLSARLTKPQALTYWANRVKACGQQRGATVQLAQVTAGERTLFIAGINSSADWTPEQLALLASWDVVVVPRNFAGRMNLADGGNLHAEENMAVYIDSIGGRGVRWSRAVVGAHYDTRRGSRSYVCATCRTLVEQVGGEIEPPF